MTAREIFDHAADLPSAEQRAAYLDLVCAGDEATRSEVEQLLQAAADLSSTDPFDAFKSVARKMLDERADACVLAPGAELEKRFKVVRLIGRGGMGEVYEATDRLGRPVALKVLLSQMRGSSLAAERFKREVEMAQRVSHANVCRMHALFETDMPGGQKLMVLTMELLDGATLKDELCDSGPYQPGEALSLARQMAAALDAAHAEGVVHRDFKPGNVMLTRTPAGEPRVKVTDFGLAGEASDEGGPSGGTVEYMAPEVKRGQPAGPASDLYAFGLVLHELLTGKRPAAEGRQLDASLPARWAAAIRRCLHHDPAQRPASAAKVVEAIEAGRAWPPQLMALLAAAMLIGTAAAGVFYIGGYGQPAAATFRNPAGPVHSIAVLAFRDAPGLEAGRALADELTAQLATVPGVRVVARSSVHSVAAAPTNDWLAVARTLKVKGLLLGRIERQGELLRVAAELIDGDSGQRVWSQVYDHPAEGASTLPGRMSAAIVTALRVPLGSGISRRTHSANARAYELFLLGKQAAAARSPEKLQESAAYFEEAVQLDARYALAWAGLADSRCMLAGRPGFRSQEWFPRAELAARRALDLDANLAEAHLAMGSIYQRFYWNWDEAERHFQRAVGLSPGLAQAHHWYAGFLSNLGHHDRALEQIRQARELDPMSPAVNNAYGAYLARAGKYDEAILQLQLTMKLDPKLLPPYKLVAESFEAKGMWDEAIANYRQALERAPGNLDTESALGYALARAGRASESRGLADKLEAAWGRGEAPASAVARVWAGLGDIRQAVAWLERAYQERDTNLLLLKIDRRHDILRTDPKYLSLVQALKLP
ncbi:MAG: protein kinase [Bryobacterales bacterium]|nr:protein kinase [Bryobacterales bacterium]